MKTKPKKSLGQIAHDAVLIGWDRLDHFHRGNWRDIAQAVAREMRRRDKEKRKGKLSERWWARRTPDGTGFLCIAPARRYLKMKQVEVREL